MEFKAYHKIRQFKDIVRDIQFKANFKGLDDNGQPVYQETKKPILTFVATTKLHGTNAQVCYDGKELLAGKRSSLIPKDSLQAHFGFNAFVHVEKGEFFKKLMKDLHLCYCNKGEQIIVYGEFAGTGIQKSVGVSELDKSFYIFDMKKYNPLEGTQQWISVKDLDVSDAGGKVYNIYDFPTWELDIDFNKPAMFQNDLIEITEEIEKECPVSKELGVDKGVGEGAVWTSFWKGEKYIFKVKGEKHSVSKVKKLASVNPEILKSIDDFVEFACTPNRMEQAIQETGATEKRHTPDVLR